VVARNYFDGLDVGDMEVAAQNQVDPGICRDVKRMLRMSRNVVPTQSFDPAEMMMDNQNIEAGVASTREEFPHAIAFTTIDTAALYGKSRC
jgi:hypothetical protein